MSKKWVFLLAGLFLVWHFRASILMLLERARQTAAARIAAGSSGFYTTYNTAPYIPPADSQVLMFSQPGAPKPSGSDTQTVTADSSVQG